MFGGFPVGFFLASLCVGHLEERKWSKIAAKDEKGERKMAEPP